MDKARVYVDFNELVEKNIVLLSKEDWKMDSQGNRVCFKEGMSISLYSDNGEDSYILAEGTVIKYDLQNFPSWKQVKWCCRFEIIGLLNKSCYKEMSGKLKIGILLEAGYKACKCTMDMQSCIRITDRIYFENALLPYPVSQQMTKEEIECFVEGVRLVSDRIEEVLLEDKVLISLYNIHFSDCDIQKEAFAVAVMQWSSEIFDFPIVEVPVKWVTVEEGVFKELLGRYEYNFNELGGSDK